MRTQKRKVAVIVLAVLAGGAACAWADVAATVDPGAITFMGHHEEESIGWRFFVDREITITHLGVYDEDDNGLTGSHILGIWRVKKTGGWQLERQVSIGPGGTTENHHVYVALSEPFTIVPDPVPYILNGVAYYERWLVGVWSPAGNVDRFIMDPVQAATRDIEQAGIIRFQNYTWKISSTFTYPWGDTSARYHYGVNFKYAVPGPQAEAGADMEIYSSQQATTVVAGTATHTHPGTAMTYQWLEGSTVLQSGTVDTLLGAANLNLATLTTALSVGSHTLTLDVTDGVYSASDTMTLTIANTPPDAQPTPTYQALELGTDAILIAAEAADFDGDTISYQWLKGGEVLASGTVTPPAGGGVVSVLDLTVAAGDPRFPLGSNDVQLVVSDGVNPAETQTVTVLIQDTTAPTVAPMPSTALLWPANHEMVPVTIWTNTQDNSGGPILLSARLQSSEPNDAIGDGSTEEDYALASIDNAAGVIIVQLRAERSGSGYGRVYTVTIVATDGSGNQSLAMVNVRVPHDRRKK